jgi:hypothetical protein
MDYLCEVKSFCDADAADGVDERDGFAETIPLCGKFQISYCDETTVYNCAPSKEG